MLASIKDMQVTVLGVNKSLKVKSLKIRNQKLEQGSKKKHLSYTQALLISSVPKTSSLKIKDI